MSVLTETEFDGLMEYATKCGDRIGPYCGLENDEATSLFLEDVATYPDEYDVLWRSDDRGIIFSRFNRVARMNARADRIRRMAEECEIVYQPEYVRLFLPFFFAYEDWSAGPSDGTGSKPGWRTTDAIDTALDIKAAWSRLKPWQLDIIVCRNRTDPRDANGRIDWEAIAAECGYKNGSTAAQRYRDATYQLAIEMTGSKQLRKTNHVGPGGRKALSNSSAAAVISNY